MFTFADAIQALREDGNGILRVAREARPGSDYVLANILPEIGIPNYQAKSSSMRIFAVMAGMAAQSSPYAPGGATESASFREATIKLANEIPLREEDIRAIHELIASRTIQAAVSGQALDIGAISIKAMIEQILGFTDKTIVQSHLDTAEWLRGRALTTGQINWTFNDIPVAVDYEFNTDNINAQQTGNDAWGGSASKFWEDVRFLRRVLRYAVDGFYAHPDTISEIIDNSVNNITIIAQNEITNAVTLQKTVSLVGTPALSSDKRDTVTLIPVGASGNVYDLSTTGKNMRLKDVPFFQTGVIVAIGRQRRNQWIVSAGAPVGSTPEAKANRIGYTHIAPTVEAGDMTPGRWANAYVPQGQQWQIIGQGASNLLPVIEDVDRIARVSSEM